jgi:hypothetical protein
MPLSTAAKSGRPSGKSVVQTSLLLTPSGGRNSHGVSLSRFYNPVLRVCVWMLGFPSCLCQGAVPDGLDVPILTCLSFYSPLLLVPATLLPRPAPAPAPTPARPMPRAYPRRRRAQPRACSTRFMGRHIIAIVSVIRICCSCCQYRS